MPHRPGWRRMLGVLLLALGMSAIAGTAHAQSGTNPPVITSPAAGETVGQPFSVQFRRVYAIPKGKLGLEIDGVAPTTWVSCAYTDCSVNSSPYDPTEGEHTIRVIAANAEGVVTATSAPRTIRVDRSAPTRPVVLDPVNNQPRSEAVTTVRFTESVDATGSPVWYTAAVNSSTDFRNLPVQCSGGECEGTLHKPLNRDGFLYVRATSIGGFVTSTKVNVPYGLSIDQKQFDYGTWGVGSESLKRTFTVTNNGSTPVTLGQSTVSPEWRIAGDTPGQTPETCSGATLAPGGTCFVRVRFSPFEETSSPELIEGQLRVQTSGGAAVLAYLSGTAVRSLTIAAEPFPDQPVATQGPAVPWTITNGASAPVRLGAATLAKGTEFHVASDSPGQPADTCSGVSLAAGASCQIWIRFSPTGPSVEYGGRTADMLNLPYGRASLLRRTVSARATTSLKVIASSREFAPQPVGTTSAFKTFKVVNHSDQAISVTHARTEGPFAISGNGQTANFCKRQPLPPGETCNIRVTFTPPAAQFYSGRLIVGTASAPDAAWISITGNGT